MLEVAVCNYIMGMKTLVLLLLLSVAATTLVQSLPTDADVSEEQDIEGEFNICFLINSQAVNKN